MSAATAEKQKLRTAALYALLELAECGWTSLAASCTTCYLRLASTAIGAADKIAPYAALKKRRPGESRARNISGGFNCGADGRNGGWLKKARSAKTPDYATARTGEAAKTAALEALRFFRGR